MALLRSRAKSISQSESLRSSEPAASQKLSHYFPSTHHHTADVSSSLDSLHNGASSSTPLHPLPLVSLRGIDGVEPNPNAALAPHTLYTQGIRQPVQPFTHDERHSRKSARRRAPPRIPIPSLSPRLSSRGRVILDDTEPQNIPPVSSERSPTRHLFLDSSRLPDPPPPSAYDDLRRQRSPNRARSSSMLRASKRGTQPLSQGSCFDEPFHHENSCFSEDTIPHVSVSQQGRFTMVDPMYLRKAFPNSPPPSPPHQPIATPKANNSPPFPPISFRPPSHISVSSEDDLDSRFGRLSSIGDSGSLRIGRENAYTTRSSRFTYGHRDSRHSLLLSDSALGSNIVESQLYSEDFHPSRSSESLHQQQVGYPCLPPNGSGSPTITPVVNHLSALSSVTTLPSRIVASLRPRSIAPSTRSTSLAHSVRSPSVYSNESPYFPRVPITNPPKLSFSKRFKRTFSFRSSRPSKDVGRGVQERLRSPSLNRRSNTLYGDSSTIRTFHSESQIFSPRGVQAARKLRKKRPSLIAEASTPPLTSEMSRPSSILEHPYPHPKMLSRSPMKRVNSSPSPQQWVETPPPVPPLPVAFKTGPHAESSLTSRQSTESVDKSRKQPKTTSAGSDATLSPVASPPVMGSKGPNFSEASRSRSTPNLFPRAVARLSVPNPQPYTTGSDTPLPQRFLANSAGSLASDKPPLRKSQRPISCCPSSDSLSPQRPLSNRRWTLAAFEVPDEQLVSELDRLRSIGWWLGPQGELIRVKGKGKPSHQIRETEVEQDTIKEKAEDEKWRVARQALMVCREIVRTERSYREAMARLQRGEVGKSPPGPPILLQYLPALISASQAFSERLDDDPSTWGVSAAFIGVEDVLETALVAWSGIVGEFFFAKGRQRRRWSTAPGDKEKKEKDKKAVIGASVLPRVRSVVDTSHRGQETYDAIKSSPSIWRTSMPALSQLLTPGSEGHQIESQKPKRTSSAPAKTPTVHDLAIQPTQRVMRYVLLYKDLLNSTPVTSPARPLVEYALESATRIAQRCNRAQDNAASLT